MKERPILFSGPMVRALLDGRKTQTRRVVKPQPDCNLTSLAHVRGGPNVVVAMREGMYSILCPYGQPGDRLWVRETHRFPKTMDDEPARGIEALCREANYRKPWAPKKFEADGSTTDLDILHDFGTGEWGKIRPSIFMPRWASRLTLEIVSVRVERVQEIREKDAIAEGIESREIGDGPSARMMYRDYSGPKPVFGTNPKFSFMSLWDSINAKRDGGKLAWAANPWVWVVEFKRILP